MTATTLNPADKSANMTLLAGNLECQNVVSGGNIGVRATFSASTGLFYFESKFIANDQPYYNTAGIVKTSAALSNVFAATNGVGVASAGEVNLNAVNNLNINAGTTIVGLWVGHAVNLNSQRYWAKVISGGVNGFWNGVNTADPVGGTGGIDISGAGSINGQSCAPFQASSSSTAAALDALFNFGATNYQGIRPTGFGDWNAVSGLPASGSELQRWWYFT